MGDVGRAHAITALSSLTPDGRTNIWLGLSKSLESLRQAAQADAAAGLGARKATARR